MKHLLRFASLVVVGSCTIASGLGIDLRLGNSTFAYPRAKSISVPIPVTAGIGSFRFLSRIGGVAFGGRAVSADGTQVANLRYDRSQPDGQRLIVTLTGGGASAHDVVAPIYDWQLAPIANFANSNIQACFTLFGELEDGQDPEAGHRILNYHQAFADRLLGLRLFQGDILIINPDACDLPKDNGRYLLGAGERAPNVRANRTAFSTVQSRIDSLRGGPFQSYVVGDVGVRIAFSDRNGVLKLTGSPVWHCWKMRDLSDAEIDKAEKAARTYAVDVMKRELKQDSERLSSTALRIKYTEAYIDKRRKQLEEQHVANAVESLRQKTVQTMPSYSKALSTAIQRQNGINPAVYSALQTTMRYAAFFRYVKKTNPTVFRSLVSSLQFLPQPRIKTPTELIGG